LLKIIRKRWPQRVIRKKQTTKMKGYSLENRWWLLRCITINKMTTTKMHTPRI
jgi:hypothetical protein